MSEPDISTLARRLAEQNNVEWRSLGGSGPSGKVVERDVLDYLARVMAGMESVDSTPEPVPEGMEAWPDQDAPSYVHDVASDDVEAAATADGASPDLSGAHEVSEPAAPYTAASPSVEGSSVVDVAGSAADPVDDELLSDDVFLFDDDEPPEQPSPAASTSAFSGGGAYSAGSPFAGGPEEVAATPHDLPDEVDDLLLVEDEADGVQDEAYGDSHGAAAGSRDAQPEPAFDAPSSDHFAHGGSGFSTDAFASDDTIASAPQSADSYAEASEVDDASWGVEPPTSDPFGFSDDSILDSSEDGTLPDLWASDDDSPQETVTAEPFGAAEPADDVGPWVSDHEADASSLTDDAVAATSEDWHDGGEVAPPVDDATPSADSWLEGSHDAASVSADAGVAPWGGEALGDGDDLVTLDEAERLDELDALEDVEALDGTLPELDVAAAVAALPLVRSGAVLRRHLDVSALAAAQLAVGVELGGDPLEAAPFLLRAVARAAAELGVTGGQVALAELRGSVKLRRVDEAGSRSFRSLVEDLEQDGSEEDEVGLVAVDLSGLDVDEVVLDVAVPAVTLGRILYDTQHGAYRSTLALTGDLPLEKGAKLLSRVAELLGAPVRLLL